MKNEVIFFYKNPGETPLQAFGRLRVEKPDLATEKMSYAGRLDPLAEGEMLVLVGEACKDKAKYTGLDKTYVVDILFGVATDTHDVLGLITSTSDKQAAEADISKTLPGFVGDFRQPYPDYSSKTFEGKQLFEHARLGRNIPDSSRPYKDVTIYSIHVVEYYTLTLKELLKKVKEKINSIIGDFRQDLTLEKWDEFFKKQSAEKQFFVVKVRVHCSSGTYMRVLADELGKKLGADAIAFHIKREKIHV